MSEKTARIAIEVSALATPRPSGVARYASRLVRTLLELRVRGEGEHDYRVCTRLSRWKHRAHRPHLADLPHFWYQEPLIPLARRPHLVHGTDVRTPSWPGIPKVATLHDVFALLSEEWAPAEFRRKKIREYRRMARSCERIIAVSEATRQSFLERVDYPAERISVVHEGVSPRFRPRDEQEVKALRERHGLEKPYLLFVGGADRRKNLLGLMRALAGSPLARDFDLVVVGGRGHEADAVLADPVVRELGEGLRLMGYLPDPELPALYSGAAAFCMPSFCEGFGLPLLEAMSCGVPVVGAERGAIPEIAGGHAWLVEPESTESIALALERAIGSKPAQREAARKHAQHFSWEACARGVLGVYMELLGI